MDFPPGAGRAIPVPMMTAGPAVLKNSLRCVLLGIDTLAPSAIFGERSPPYIQRGFALTLWRGSRPGFRRLPALRGAQWSVTAKKWPVPQKAPLRQRGYLLPRPSYHLAHTPNTPPPHMKLYSP